jgi:hypothetical protein
LLATAVNIEPLIAPKVSGELVPEFNGCVPPTITVIEATADVPAVGFVKATPVVVVEAYDEMVYEPAIAGAVQTNARDEDPAAAYSNNATVPAAFTPPELLGFITEDKVPPLT